jgi:hypothetical protein
MRSMHDVLRTNAKTTKWDPVKSKRVQRLAHAKATITTEIQTLLGISTQCSDGSSEHPNFISGLPLDGASLGFHPEYGRLSKVSPAERARRNCPAYATLHFSASISSTPIQSSSTDKSAPCNNAISLPIQTTEPRQMKVAPVDAILASPIGSIFESDQAVDGAEAYRAQLHGDRENICFMLTDLHVDTSSRVDMMYGISSQYHQMKPALVKEGSISPRMQLRGRALLPDGTAVPASIVVHGVLPWRRMAGEEPASATRKTDKPCYEAA